MTLWILRPVQTLPDNENPWEPWYDKSFGFVVRAKTETRARKIAHEHAGCENEREDDGGKFSDASPWLNSNYSTCVELLPAGDTGLVMKDFRAA